MVDIDEVWAPAMTPPTASWRCSRAAGPRLALDKIAPAAERVVAGPTN